MIALFKNSCCLSVSFPALASSPNYKKDGFCIVRQIVFVNNHSRPPLIRSQWRRYSDHGTPRTMQAKLTEEDPETNLK